MLTAAHVIIHHTPVVTSQRDQALDQQQPDDKRFLVVGVDLSRGGVEFSCIVVWMDKDADLALLQVVPTREDAWQTALAGTPTVVFAESGTSPMTVTAAGFPEATLTDSDNFPAPDQTLGILLPQGGGSVTGRIPVDLSTTPPGNAHQWEGMSGAALHEQPDGRLVGVITDTTLYHAGDTARELARLHASRIPDPTTHADFDAALRGAGVASPILEDHHAPLHRQILEVLDPAGRPYLLGQLPFERLGEIGPRRARNDIDQQGDLFYPFITRPSDQLLRDAITARIQGIDKRVLLLVGHPMTGKSRTLLEALRATSILADARLLCPLPHADLPALTGIARRLTADGWVIVWLDDIQRFSPLTSTHLRELLAVPHVLVAGTLRPDEDSQLQDTERAFANVLADEHLVGRIRQPEWTPDDIATVPAATPFLVTSRLRDGEPLGRILGAAPELVRRLNNGTLQQQALANLVADWPRTGRTTRLPEQDARILYPTYLLPYARIAWDDLTDRDQDQLWEGCLDWCRQLVAGAAPLISRTRDGLATDPIHTHHRTNTPLPTELWQHALITAISSDDHIETLRVGTVAASAESEQLLIAHTAFRHAATSPDPLVAILAVRHLSNTFDSQGQSEEVAAAYQDIMNRFGNDPSPAVHEQLASSLYYWGAKLDLLDRHPEAIAKYDQVVERFGNDPTPAVREQVAKALNHKGDTQMELDRPIEALAVFQDLVDRFENDTTPEVREQVAMALNGKAAALVLLDQPADALATYDQVVDRFGKNPNLTIRGALATALIHKGIILELLDRLGDAVATYQDLVNRFGKDPVPMVLAPVSVGLLYRDVALGRLGSPTDARAAYLGLVAMVQVYDGINQELLDRPADAVAAYQDLVDRFGNDPTPAVREQAAMALLRKGNALERLDQLTDAVAAYQDLVDRFGNDPTSTTRGVVVSVLVQMGVVLERLDQLTDAVAAYQDLVDRFGNDPTPTTRGVVASVLVQMGVVLERLDQPTDAVAAYQDLVDRFGNDPTPAVREQAAIALVLKGVVLGRLDQPTDAVAAYQDLVDRFGNDPTPAVREQAAMALYNIGVTREQLDPASAVAAYQDLVDRFGNDPSPAVREQAAMALLRKGIGLEWLDRPAEEMAAYQDLVDRFGNDPTPAVREQAAMALLRKGNTLERLDRPSDAVAAYQDLVDRFGNDRAPGVLQEVVQLARSAMLERQ